MKLKTYFPLISFLLRLNILLIPLYLSFFLNISFPHIQIFLANIITRVLVGLGYNSKTEGYFITIFSGENVNIEINADCTGWKSIYTLTALIIATPYSSLNKKIFFLIISLPSLFFLNFIRILSTILLSLIFGLQYFETVHNLLWREGMIAIVLLIWYFWLIKVKHNSEQKKYQLGGFVGKSRRRKNQIKTSPN
ncbi:MAG: exosortase/archaeosortase family protein [Candidatus Aenigmatarchaeota archaeon]